MDIDVLTNIRSTKANSDLMNVLSFAQLECQASRARLKLVRARLAHTIVEPHSVLMLGRYQMQAPASS